MTSVASTAWAWMGLERSVSFASSDARVSWFLMVAHTGDLFADFADLFEGAGGE